MTNGLEKYTGFSINKRLRFFDSFQFLSSAINSLVKSFAKDDYKHQRQEFDNNVLDLIKQKPFYSHEYMSNFEKFKKQFPSKERFYSSWIGKKISDKEYEHVLKVSNKFDM